MKRIWFYGPELYWRGWRTLKPIWTACDEYRRRTLVIGWNVTGQIVVAFGACRCEACEDERTGVIEIVNWLTGRSSEDPSP